MNESLYILKGDMLIFKESESKNKTINNVFRFTLVRNLHLMEVPYIFNT